MKNNPATCPQLIVEVFNSTGQSGFGLICSVNNRLCAFFTRGHNRDIAVKYENFQEQCYVYKSTKTEPSSI